MCIRKLQLTLALFKPDVSSQPLIIQEIRSLILDKGLYFVRSKQLRLSRERAALFYHDHRGKFFHNRLVSFMSSGPLSAHILAGDNVIVDWRKMMGPTKVLKTIYEEPFSIRGRFGLTDTRNCTHGSDSKDSASTEIKIFFPEFDEESWYSEEECFFREGKVKYDAQKMCHLF